MNKTFLISVILIIVFKLSFSQIQTGINLGIGLNNEIVIQNKHRANSEYVKVATSFNLGTLATIDFLKIFSFSTELNFSSKGVNYYNPIISKFERIYPLYIENLLYIDIKVFKKYSISVGGTNNFFINSKKIFKDEYYEIQKYTNSYILGFTYYYNDNLSFKLFYNNELKPHIIYFGEERYFKSLMFKMFYCF